MRKLNLQEMTLVSGGDCTKGESQVLTGASAFVLGSLGVGSAVGAIFGAAKIGGIAAVTVMGLSMFLIGVLSQEDDAATN